MDHEEDIRFDHDGDVAIYRGTARRTLSEGVERMRRVLVVARVRGIAKLLIDITRSTGYEVPSLSSRLAMMRVWAAVVGSSIRIAVVCRPEFIDPQRFGLTMATRFGMLANVFDDEADAMAWLKQH